MNPIPQVMRPAIEVSANKSTFTGRPIESAAFEKMPPAERKNVWTSETAIALAHGYDKIAWDQVKLSPIQVEHLIRSYMGWVGATGLGILDKAIRPLTGAPERPSMRVEQYPVVGRFFRESPNAHSKYETLFYEQLNAARQAYADVQYYKKLGDSAKAGELTREKQEELRAYKVLEPRQAQLGKLNARMKLIQANRGMSAEEKRQQIDRLDEIKNHLVRGATASATRAGFD